jgi:predicted transcriptional regulator of viral defense system
MKPLVNYRLRTLDPEVLTVLASTVATATIRRLGYLLTLLNHQDLLSTDVEVVPVLERLQEHLHAQPSAQPALLDPRGPRRGTRDPAWGLILNTDVEPDL